VIGLYLEKEQKGLSGYKDLSWKEYFLSHSLRDIIANTIGILAALYLFIWR
jgi:hypothetical protein